MHRWLAVSISIVSLFVSMASASDSAPKSVERQNYSGGPGSFFNLRAIARRQKGIDQSLLKSDPVDVRLYQELFMMVDQRREQILREYKEFSVIFFETLKHRHENGDTIKPGGRDSRPILSGYFKIIQDELRLKIPNNFIFQYLDSRNISFSNTKFDSVIATELETVVRRYFCEKDVDIARPSIQELTRLTAHQARAFFVKAHASIFPDLPITQVHIAINPYETAINRNFLAEEVDTYRRYRKNMMALDPDQTYGKRIKNGFDLTSQAPEHILDLRAHAEQWLAAGHQRALVLGKSGPKRAKAKRVTESLVRSVGQL